MKSKNSEHILQDSRKRDAKAINSLKNRTVVTIKDDTQVSFSSDNAIVAYHLDKVMTDILSSIANKLKVTISWADCVTDLIAFPAFMNIVNPLKLTEKEMDEVFQWFSFLEETGDPKGLCILFTSVPTFKIPAKVKKYIIKTPEIIDGDYLKLKILNKRTSAARHKNQHRSYDRKIFRILSILKVLKTQKVMHIEDMCNDFNVCPKTIKRDIDLLNALGEIIEYDKVKKGYVLLMEDGAYSQHL